MELKRNIYQKLLRWKEENTGRVLELKGARQVGKTYILKKFGKENFQKMIYINMAEWSGDIFLKCLETATDWKPGEPYLEHPLQEALKLYDQTFTDDKETVIIIDEIQESAQVYNQIRTFAREFQAYVIVAESYPGKISQSDFFFPVGDVDSMKMEVLTFDEFLDAFGERKLYEAIDLYGKGKSEDYEKLMSYYEVYQKIGGYPVVVVSYAEEKDLDKCFGIIKGLMEVFENESKRYLTDIADVNLFQKLFHAIALLMIQEKQGVRDLTSELSKIAYQEESGRMTKKMVNHAISWLQESHMLGYASKAVDCDYKQIKDNSRYYFLDMGIAYYFLSRTGAPYETVKGLLAENFVYLALRRRIENIFEIAGIVPWFAAFEKIHGDLDFYVRSLLDYKDYGIKVKGTDAEAKTARKLVEDKKVDYLYLLKDEVKDRVDDGKIFTVPLCLADRLIFGIQ
ncbi:AAA family ATPase [Candidatus Merdisoma sp. HCP28S3_D10]|uniref:AAA family ATPase n=1 Tax=unclassified Candidatus Merdisoma TaxID=3099611 RepID=UPI003F8A7D3D